MAEETIHILGKRLLLQQAPNGFKTAIDSVLVAAACPAKSRETILDLGCGVGSAGFCVLSRVSSAQLTGIDIQAENIALARDNAIRNKIGQRCFFDTADIRDWRKDSVDHIICNPPYMDGGAHLESPHKAKARAHGHSDNTALQDWLDAAFYNLRPLGSLTIIHRADQLDKILQGLGRRFGATEIIPLWPKQNKEAKRIIIRTYKNRKSPCRLHNGLVLHKDNGDYTAQAEKILREAAPLL